MISARKCENNEATYHQAREDRRRRDPNRDPRTDPQLESGDVQLVDPARHMSLVHGEDEILPGEDGFLQPLLRPLRGGVKGTGILGRRLPDTGCI